MARKSVNNKDLGNNQLLNFRVQLLASDPSSPSEARLWYNSTAHTLRYWNGTAVAEIGALDTEAVQDIIGAMVAGNTETGIAVTYDDPSGKLNFVVTDSPTVGGLTPTQLRDFSLTTGQRTAASAISDFQTAVDARVQAIVGAAPAALDTLAELAAALGNDANYSATVTAALAAHTTRLDALEANGGPIKRYATTIGNGALTSFTITHNLNSKDVGVVSFYEVATGDEWDLPDVNHATVNTLTLSGFTTAPTTNQFRVVVMG